MSNYSLIQLGESVMPASEPGNKLLFKIYKKTDPGYFLYILYQALRQKDFVTFERS